MAKHPVACCCFECRGLDPSEIPTIGAIIPGDSLEESVCQEADRIVNKGRGDVYGHPIDDFGKVTKMAHALWGRGPVSPEEHALYMILVKLARLEATPGHRDSIVDICGYARTYELIMDERARRSGNT